MNRIQELEIEVRRLEDEVASLKRTLAKVYRIASAAVVRDTAGPTGGRPVGTTRWTEARFVKALRDEYEALPEERRSMNEVARVLGISRRTLLRYCERWSVLWPPVDIESTEHALARLRATQAAHERPQTPSSPGHHQSGQLAEGLRESGFDAPLGARR